MENLQAAPPVGFWKGLLSENAASPSATRIALLVVLVMLVAVVIRWFVTNEDIPDGIRALLEVAVGATLAGKVVQKYAERWR